jgi:DNA-binding MarR family transcriptional regulator
MQAPNTHYEVTWLIRRLFRAMAEVADGYLSAHGLSAADRAVLEFLYPDAALSVPGIARRYQVSRQHIQVTVNGLLQDGFLETRPNPRHKRSSLIALTRIGRDMFAKIRQIEAEYIDAMFADIPDHDVETTRQTLEAIYFHNLRKGQDDESRDH